MEQKILNWRTAAAAFAALAALLAWRLVAELRRPPPPPPSSLRLLTAPPPGATFGAGDEPLDAALSPSGNELIFVATSNGVAHLWRRSLSVSRATPIEGTEAPRWPAWIPGRRAVSFFSGDTLKQVDFDRRETSDVATIPGAAGVAWLDDGSVLVGQAKGPVTRWRGASSSAGSRLQADDVAHRFPWRVDADSWVYLAERRDGRRLVRIVSGGMERDLTDADGHAAVIDGWLVYPRGGGLLAQRLTEGRLEGRAMALAARVVVSASGRTQAALSSRVALVAQPGGQRYQLRWFDRAGAPQEIASEPGDYWQVRLSPDGGRAAVTRMESLLRTLDIYVLRAGSGAPVPVSLGLAADTDPVWSPDGRTLLYSSRRTGLFTRLVGVEGAPEEPLPPTPGFIRPTPSDWSRRDPADIVFTHSAGQPPNTDIFRRPLTGGSIARVYASGFNESDARLSADGRWAAYVSDESGQSDIYVQAWPQGPRARVSQAGGTRPRWAGASIYFLRGNDVMRAARRPGTLPVFDVPQHIVTLPGVRDFDVAQHGERLLAIVSAGAADSEIAAFVEWQTPLVAEPDPAAEGRVPEEFRRN